MLCRRCKQLEEAVAVSLSPDLPSLLLGLNEPGRRNRILQEEDRQLQVWSRTRDRWI